MVFQKFASHLSRLFVFLQTNDFDARLFLRRLFGDDDDDLKKKKKKKKKK